MPNGDTKEKNRKEFAVLYGYAKWVLFVPFVVPPNLHKIEVRLNKNFMKMSLFVLLKELGTYRFMG